MNLRVKEICKAKGLLMEELANKLGVTRVTLTRNINGNPTIETLDKIARALEVNITELFDQPVKDNTQITCSNCGKNITIKVE